MTRAMRPPAPDEVAQSLEKMRAGLRRHAEVFAKTATIAADGGELQAALRALSDVIDRQVDALDLDAIDPAEYSTRRDTVALGLLNMTLEAGFSHYGLVARNIRTIMMDTNGD